MQVMQTFFCSFNLPNFTDLQKWGQPDWGHAEAITLPYTATKDGYILRNILTNSWLHLNIGNTGLQSFAGAAGNYDSTMIPVRKGNQFTRNTSGGTWYIYFVPLTGNETPQNYVIKF